MNAFSQLLDKYPLDSLSDYELAMREIIQKICLLGLWRSKFFEHAAFYGGTALRLFYGMDRFSEDLDFSLLKPKVEFKLSGYFDAVREEMEAFGLNARIEGNRLGVVESAFIKMDTRGFLIKAEAPVGLIDRTHREKALKVKFEVDVDPPGKFETESRFLLEPIPFSVRIYTQPCLFAGKIHAILCRQWKGRVKGRDWYDLIFYADRKTPLDLEHLRERLLQTGSIEKKEKMDGVKVRELLRHAVGKLDVAQAKKDVLPFVKDQKWLDGWSKELFYQIIDGLVMG